ncbi:MAG: NfeD family protein [Actinomycetota bacterium]|nr:NfeD family protein [Actinomycetota bacterium]
MYEFGPWLWAWIVLAAALFIGEIFTAGFFMLPFGIGASAAAVLEFLGVGPVWQWIAFIGVSAIAFMAFRTVVDRLTHEPPVRTGVDRLIGKRGLVIEELVPDSPVGQVRIEREEWRADTPGHQVIPVGTTVVVDSVVGAHLMVHPATAEDDQTHDRTPGEMEK